MGGGAIAERGINRDGLWEGAAIAGRGINRDGIWEGTAIAGRCINIVYEREQL